MNNTGSFTEVIYTDFSFAYGAPICSASFRAMAEDFIVVENLGFAPEGVGEHIYLDVTKTGENTAWVAKSIAQFAGVNENDVSYCGKKDRHAIARQWFSVYYPKGKSLDWPAFEKQNEGLKIHSVSRGGKKLRPGQHAGNHFWITLKDVDPVFLKDIDKRCEKIKQNGVPNYFGEQRFGRDNNNLELITQWLDRGAQVLNRKNKNILISAARSYLFNRVLHKRVELGIWTAIIDGDCVDAKAQIATGPLWGRGRSKTAGDALLIEQSALEGLQNWCLGLEHVGLQHERRDFVLGVKGLEWKFLDGRLQLAFYLPPGQYATSILRELFVLENKSLVGASEFI